MDNQHIAIITLQQKAAELQKHRQQLEAEKQDLDRRIKEAAFQITDLHTAVKWLQTGLEQLSNPVHYSLKRAEATGTPEAQVKEKEKDTKAYPHKGTLREKILFILHRQKRFLHSREIAEYIVAYEPEEDVEKVVELISKQVARYKRNKHITSVADYTGRHTFYGLPDWLDKNKKIVRGYESVYAPAKKRGGA